MVRIGVIIDGSFDELVPLAERMTAQLPLPRSVQ
jgi:hypothetical protein